MVWGWIGARFSGHDGDAAWWFELSGVPSVHWKPAFFPARSIDRNGGGTTRQTIIIPPTIVEFSGESDLPCATMITTIYDHGKGWLGMTCGMLSGLCKPEPSANAAQRWTSRAQPDAWRSAIMILGRLF
jgi:hypothetical protein